MKISNLRLGNSLAICSSALAVVGATAIVSAAAPAQAFAPVTIGFDCVTTTANAASACAAGENQFKARVESVANRPDQVLFRFMNTIRPNGSSVIASITNVLFADTSGPGDLLSLDSVAGRNIDNVGNVDFIRTTTTTLPGLPSSFFNASFASRSNPRTPGVLDNGINLGEELGILINIRQGFTDPINAVITDLQQGGLRLGLVAGGFGGGNAEFRVAYVNSAVPEPMTMLGTGAALGMGAWMKRRQLVQQKKAKAEVG